jgi:hypothetical protein
LVKFRKSREAAGSSPVIRDCKDIFIWFRDLLEDPDVFGRIILRLIFRKWDLGVWTVSMWLRIQHVAGTC